MQPPVDGLIAAAVEPLSENAEHRLAAINILEESADLHHPGAAQTIARWQKVDASRATSTWKISLYIVALLIALPMVSVQVPDLRLAQEYREMWDAWEIPEIRIPAGLSPSEKLLLGDPLESDYDQKEALYRSDTENPAYYSEYAIAYRNEFGKLPDNYLETVSRIAPKNSYFLYCAAGLTAREALDQTVSATPKPQSKANGGPISADLVEDDFVILDQASFEEALSLLEKAASLPEYETYWTTMKRSRLQAMPKGGTFAERTNKILMISKGLTGVSSVNFVTHILCAQAQQLSRAGDVEGFLALAKTREHLIRSVADSPDLSLLHEIIFVMSASVSAEYLHYSAKRLGLDEMSDRYLAEVQVLRDSNDRRKARNGTADDSWLSERGSPTTDSSLGTGIRVADSPPPLTIADLSPTRYADHTLMMRAGLAAGTLILIAASLLVFLFRFAFPPALRKTAERLTLLLRPVDWIIVILVGTILPFAAIVSLQQFTDLSGREWAVNHFRYLFPGVHLAALLILLLLAPVFLIRWRLSKRIAPLGLPCRPGFMSALALLAVVALPFAAYPIVQRFGSEPTVVKVLAAVPAFWFTAMLWNSLQVFIAKPAPRISQAATSMALLPVYAIAIILTALSLPIFRASEESWLAKDTIHNFETESLEDGQYEARLAAQKRKETKALLGL